MSAHYTKDGDGRLLREAGFIRARYVGFFGTLLNKESAKLSLTSADGLRQWITSATVVAGESTVMEVVDAVCMMANGKVVVSGQHYRPSCAQTWPTRNYNILFLPHRIIVDMWNGRRGAAAAVEDATVKALLKTQYRRERGIYRGIALEAYAGKTPLKSFSRLSGSGEG